MKKVIVVCDQETEYARRLTEFMNSKKNLPFRAEAFDSFEEANRFMEHNKTEMLLLSEVFTREEYRNEGISETYVRETIILTEDSGPAGEGRESICKYSSGDDILREVMHSFEAGQTDFREGEKRKKGAKLLTVWSPAGGTGQTSFALSLGFELAKEKRVLYLNFGCCPALEEILGITDDWTLSDLLFHTKNEPETIKELIPQITVRIHNLDLILPVLAYFDISETTAEEWLQILKGAEECGAYDIILVEPENGMQGFEEIFKMSDRIYMPYRADPITLAKLKSWEEMLDDEEPVRIDEKTLKVKMPFFYTAGLGSNYYEALIWSELGDCVRDLVRKEALTG